MTKPFSGGQAAEFADAFMTALGDATTLSMADTFTILYLYRGARSICKVPPSMTEAGGDKATGSPALSVAQACSKRGSHSSSEDETSQNMTPLVRA